MGRDRKQEVMEQQQKRQSREGGRPGSHGALCQGGGEQHCQLLQRPHGKRASQEMKGRESRASEEDYSFGDGKDRQGKVREEWRLREILKGPRTHSERVQGDLKLCCRRWDGEAPGAGLMCSAAGWGPEVRSHRAGEWSQSVLSESLYPVLQPV